MLVQVKFEQSMKQSGAVQFLYRDLKVVTSRLALENYDSIFEAEMEEYFPFNETIMKWLSELYKSEKYGAFDKNKLSLYFEKDHPFLFIRDMAHMNCWNLGYRRGDRRDHITGLMFSSNPTFALEATLCLCRPSLIDETPSSWFDFKQAMTNLETTAKDNINAQAWKACAMFYLYFQLSQDGQSVSREELLELLEPYLETIEIAILEGNEDLRQECGRITRLIRAQDFQTILDGLAR